MYGPISTSSERRIQSLCRAPYPRHPHGCPNIDGKCRNLSLFDSLYQPDTYVGVLQVDFKELLRLRISLHPDWTVAEIRNPIQWQPHFRVSLRQSMELAQLNYPGTIIENVPEGRGVNVFRDLLSIGVPIERRPTINLFLVSYLCYPKN